MAIIALKRTPWAACGGASHPAGQQPADVRLVPEHDDERHPDQSIDGVAVGRDDGDDQRHRRTRKRADARDAERLVEREPRRRSGCGGQGREARATPSPVATPFPPRNPSQTGKQCPITAEIAQPGASIGGASGMRVAIRTGTRLSAHRGSAWRWRRLPRDTRYVGGPDVSRARGANVAACRRLRDQQPERIDPQR